MKIITIVVFALLIIGILAACSKAAPKSEIQPALKDEVQAKKVTHVDAKQAYAALKADPKIIVVDVRTPSEFNEGHLEGAVNVDFKNAEFATNIAKLDTSKKYLIHCRSGGRSRGALKVMQSAGFADVTHMDGGMLGWAKAELPIEN